MTPRVIASEKKLPSFRRHRPAPIETPAVQAEAFWNWVTMPSMPDADVSAVELLSEAEFRVLSKAASGGGYLVPSDVSDQIVLAARAASPMLQVASQLTTADGQTMGVPLASTHGSAAWIAESGSYTPSDETITQASMSAFKAGTKLLVSEELLTDSVVDVDRWLSTELGQRLGTLANNAMTVGDGSGKPLGIVHASSPYSVTTAAAGSASAFKLADVKAVWKSLGAAYRQSAVWMAHPDDVAELASLADTAGGLVLPSLQFDPPSLFGRPLVLNADMPTGASAKSIAVGDFRLGYCVRRVDGISLQRQDEIASDSGQIGYRANWRIDGRPTLTSAVVILQHSAT